MSKKSPWTGKKRWLLPDGQDSAWDGFTLIELLVVVAIIGVLSALLMSNFIGVRQRARDAQRKSDLRQIQSSLELYRSDQGAYPVWTSGALPCGSTAQINSNGIVNNPTGGTGLQGGAAAAVYMQKIPCDPTAGTGYTYNSSAGTSYTLIACLENSTDSQKDSTNVAPCNGTTSFSYTLTNP